MPRANSSGRSGGRRNSRSESSGNRRSSGRPSRKTDSRGGGSARGKRSDGPPRGERPLRKSDKPFERKSRSSSSESGGSYGKKRYGSSEGSGRDGSARSFKKSEKPFGKKREDGGGERRTFRKSDDRPERSFKRSEKPYGKKDQGTGTERRSSRNSDSRSEKPLKKFDKPYGKKDQGTGVERKSSKSSDGRSERPFKKFDKPYGRKTEDRGSDRKSYRGSGERSFDKPRKRRDDDREGKSPRPSAGKRKFSDDKRGFASKRKTFGDSVRGTQDTVAPVQTEKMRLNRFIANSGVCSRREADELITMGVISVNGKTITELGYKVNPGDEVRYENKVLRAEKPVYILMNKPKGYLTTTDDPQERNTVMHIIGNAVKERIYPVGRLDRNTTGLLLLTNDGDLADKLMHPSYNAKKIYKVELDRPLSKADFQTILDGVRLEEGRAVVDDLAILDDGKTVGIELHIGWNRVVRRIFESLNYEVLKLDRSVYAGLDKKDLARGHWRYLTKEEIVRLKHYK